LTYLRVLFRIRFVQKAPVNALLGFSPDVAAVKRLGRDGGPVLAALSDRGLSDSTRRQALTVLRACLDGAVRDGLLATNPAAAVTRPVVRRSEALHYSPTQVAALLDTADSHRLRPCWSCSRAPGCVAVRHSR
jgi:integrase